MRQDTNGIAVVAIGAYFGIVRTIYAAIIARTG